ncbi:MAG: transcription antitermination protein NusB [Bacteroidetes bacterium]|nr:transcription antitermination protein NusB [Bacteroidota bacterium]
MISRRLVRIKALQSLYSFQQGESLSDFQWPTLTPKQKTYFDDTLSHLIESIQQSHDFYLFLLDFPFQLSQYLLEEQALEKAKFYPDQTKIRRLGLLDRMPLVKYLHRAVTGSQRKSFAFDWNQLSAQLDTFYQWMQEWDFVNDIDFFEQPTFEQQQAFLEEFYANLFETKESFFDTLNDYYPGWSDDELYTTREIEKTIQGAQSNGTVPVANSPSSNSEEVELAQQLFTTTAKNSLAYESQISEISDNWDPSRIAVMDLLIIKLTLTEFLHCPTIPVKVTINEYLEITKNYSTPNSSRFVNGVLDKLRIVMEDQGMISKSGRGLRDK